MSYVVPRTLVNRGGVSYDATKTSVIFAEDMNKIKDNEQYLKDTKADGASSSVANAIAIFSDTTGKILKYIANIFVTDGGELQLGNPTVGQTRIAGGTYPYFQFYDSAGVIRGALISDPTVGATIFDYSGAVAGKTGYFGVRDVPNGGTFRLFIDLNGNVSIGDSNPVANVALAVNSTTKAFMPPRMTTTQMNAIASPLEGMMIYNTTTHTMYFRNASAWAAI